MWFYINKNNDIQQDYEVQTFKGSRTVIIDLRIKKRKCEENMCKLVNSLDDDDEKRLCWFETN